MVDKVELSTSLDSLARVQRAACYIAGLYGVVYGIFMIPTGLFVGPHILIAAMLHIVIGSSYFITGLGLGRGKSWAAWTSLVLSLLVTSIGVLAVIESYNMSDTTGLLFCGPFTIAFALLATASFIVALKR